MTKEQFLTFKSDLKLSVEAIKTYKRFESGKKWYNMGHSSEEEYIKDCNDAWEKSCEIESKRTVNKDKGAAAYSFRFHWAYYCAKHQLSKDERLAYYKEQIKLLRPNKQYYYVYTWYDKDKCEKKFISSIENILKAYGEEDIICFD